MGGQALFTDLTGNPEDARLRIAPQDQTKVSGNLVYPDPPAADTLYQQGHFDGQGLMLSQTEIEDLVLGTSGMPQDGLAGKRNIEGGPLRIGTVDPANPIMISALAGVFGAYEQDDNTTWEQWRFFLDAAAGTGGGGDVVKAFQMQENGQVFTPIRATGLKFTGFEWSADADGPFQIEFPYEVDRYDLFGDITQSAGSGSTKPVVIGSFSGNLAAQATDQDIHIKFTTATSPYTIQAKVGTAAAYSNNQTLTEGEWLYLQNESGVRIGDFRDQARIYIASGATITLNDEFTIPRRHVGWSDSLGTRRPISSVNVRAYIDTDPFGTPNLFEIPATGLSGSAIWDDVQVNQHIPTSQGKDISIGGSLIGEVNLTRRIRDLLFQKGIVNGDEVGFVLDAQSDTQIGSTGKYFRFLDIRPRCNVSGSTFQTPAGGGGARDESPVLMAKEPPSAYTYDGETYAKHISILLQNSVADISSLVEA